MDLGTDRDTMQALVGDILEINPRALPLFTEAHAAPSCRTKSRMAKGEHKRTRDNNFLGETLAAETFNKELEIIIDIFKDQKNRRLRVHDFAFTLEQPEGKAQFHPSIQHNVEKVLGAVRMRFNWCRFGVVRLKKEDKHDGWHISKSTDLWCGGLPEVVEAYRGRVCNKCTPCATFARRGMHALTRGTLKEDGTKYPPQLVEFHNQALELAMARRRLLPS